MAASILCAVLGGCGMVDGDPFSGNLFSNEPGAPCPRVERLSQASHLTQFGPGPGRDHTDVRFEGDIADPLAISCDYDDHGFVDVDVTIDLELWRGPAAGGDVGHYEYFVAVIDPRDTIIDKRIVAIDVKFPGEAPSVTRTEEVKWRIAFAPAPDASRHRVVVGFQLTREQVDYNRNASR